MKILHIIPSFQHPKVRGSDRHYHFIRELSRDHDITLLTLVRSAIHPEAMEEMIAYVEKIYTFDATTGNGHVIGPRSWRGANSVLKLEQLWHEYSGVRKMRKVFHQLVQREYFDVMIFHGKSVVPVIDGWEGLPTVVDFCDATSMRLRSNMKLAGKAKLLVLCLRYAQIRLVERKLVNKTPFISFISKRDREAILGPYDKSLIIPNGIDFKYWRRRTRNPRPNTLIFTGVMKYSPNEDAALYLIDEILPRIKTFVPNLEVYIVGRDPKPALLERAENRPEIKVTGFVEDIRDYMEQAMVYVAPVRFASGMQNKIQEALAMEVPVVTTSIVAEGVKTEDGEEPPLYVADEPQTLAEKVVQLLQQADERARLSHEGRDFVEKHYDWARSAKLLEQMCYEAVVIWAQP